MSENVGRVRTGIMNSFFPVSFDSSFERLNLLLDSLERRHPLPPQTRSEISFFSETLRRSIIGKATDIATGDSQNKGDCGKRWWLRYYTRLSGNPPLSFVGTIPSPTSQLPNPCRKPLSPQPCQHCCYLHTSEPLLVVSKASSSWTHALLTNP